MKNRLLVVSLAFLSGIILFSPVKIHQIKSSQSSIVASPASEPAPKTLPTPKPLPPKQIQPLKPQNNIATESLDEVNATRARRGLKPYQRDEGLTQAAMGAAAYRAQHLIAAHTNNDFTFIPKGSRASAAGCAAWPPNSGWGACCTYENWTYAGAAWAIGRDGKRYMHLFVR